MKNMYLLQSNGGDASLLKFCSLNFRTDNNESFGWS